MSEEKLIFTVDRIEEGVAVCIGEDGTVTDLRPGDGLSFNVNEGDRLLVTRVDGVIENIEPISVNGDEDETEMRRKRRSRLKGLFGKK